MKGSFQRQKRVKRTAVFCQIWLIVFSVGSSSMAPVASCHCHHCFYRKTFSIASWVFTLNLFSFKERMTNKQTHKKCIHRMFTNYGMKMEQERYETKKSRNILYVRRVNRRAELLMSFCESRAKKKLNNTQEYYTINRLHPLDVCHSPNKINFICNFKMARRVMQRLFQLFCRQKFFSHWQITYWIFL